MYGVEDTIKKKNNENKLLTLTTLVTVNFCTEVKSIYFYFVNLW